MSRDTVTVINPFEVPSDRHDEALELWDRVAAYMERQAGHVSARLHKAVDPGARFTFVTVAVWESADHFMAALGSEEMQELDRRLAEFPHSPGVYEVIRGRPGE